MLALLLGLGAPATAWAAPGDLPRLEADAAISFGCLATHSMYAGGGAASACPSAAGLTRLSYELHRRTSIVANVAPQGVVPTEAALYAQPLLIWQGTSELAPLPPGVGERLAQWLHRGGMLLVDCPQPTGTAARDACVRGASEVLAASLGGSRPVPVEASHVLYRSFYLLRGVGHGRPLVQAIRFGGRLGVVFAAEPWLAILADHGGGQSAPPGTAGEPVRVPAEPGEAADEQVLRMAINWLMYALCLDYKDDQVHLPYLLERRGQ